MSNFFVVEDSKINSERRTYKLDTDLLRGFKQAVNNNQLYRALEYMVHIVDIIDEKFSVSEFVPEVAEEDIPVATLAPSRKVGSKQTIPTPPPPKEEKVGEDK